MDNRRPDWGYQSRTLNEAIHVNPTNMVTKTNPAKRDNSGVDARSAIVMPLTDRRDWLNWILATHGPWATARILTAGYGYCDGTNENPDPLTPGNPYKLLLGGGQLVNVRYSDERWAYIQAQNFFGSPNYAITYQSHPYLILKQILVGHRQDRSMYYQVDKGEVGGVGDVYLPLMSDERYPWVSTEPLATFEKAYLEPFPGLPFDAVLYGYDVTVTEFCFTGSDVWGNVEWGDLPHGWYCLERMRITGDPEHRGQGGCGDDREVLISPWLGTSGIPVIGWTRQS
jgi:hypothetical protein